MATIVDRLIAYDDLKFLIKNGLSEVVVTTSRTNASSNDSVGASQKNMPETMNNRKRPLKSTSSGKKSPFGKDALVLTSSNEISETSRRTSPKVSVVQQPSGHMVASQHHEAGDLKDEIYWASLPQDQVAVSFKQYRIEALRRIQDLEEQVESTRQRTEAKLDALSSQFAEQKSSWQTERVALLDTLETARRYHEASEEDLDFAIQNVAQFLGKFSQLKLDDLPQTENTEMHAEIRPSSRNAEEELTTEIENDEGWLTKMTDDAKANITQESTLPPNNDDVNLVSSDEQPASESNLTELTKPSLLELVETLSNLEATIQSRKALRSWLTQPTTQSHMEHIELPTSVENKEEDNAQKARSTSKRNSLTPALPLDVATTEEYLKCYEAVIAFNKNISDIFPDKDNNNHEDDESMASDMKNLSLIQLKKTTQIIQRVLENAAQNVRAMWTTDEQDRAEFVAEGNISLLDVDSNTNVSEETSPAHSVSLKKHLRLMKNKYRILERTSEKEKESFLERINQSNSLVSGMQETITSQQEEIAALRQQLDSLADIAPKYSGVETEPPIFFTRRDSERNAKEMTVAVQENKLSAEKYRKAMQSMEDYVSIPAQRFSHLVYKYAHHKNMTEIEDNLRRRHELDEDIINMMSRMESLHIERAQRWSESMDYLSSTRLYLADELMQTFADIEQESGIFLIKPMFSYRGSYNPDSLYHGKRTRRNQPNGTIVKQGNKAPVSTAASLPIILDDSILGSSSSTGLSRSVTQFEDGILGYSKHLNGELPSPPMWSQSQSVATPSSRPGSISTNSSRSIPRILEVDVNRILIGQNNVSVRMPSKSPRSHASMMTTSNTRSYVGFNRQLESTTKRSISATEMRHSSAPPTSPTTTVKMSLDSAEVDQFLEPARRASPIHGLGVRGRNLSSTPPLPPISH